MTMTRKDVVSVLGRVDDAMIAELILTEASLAELKEAWAWVFGDDALMGPTTHREAGGGRSSRGGTARVRTSWSKPSSVVFYTPAEAGAYPRPGQR
ncbi:hypothetical protein FHS67_002028 [Aminobacter aminovorans]|uniref:Uncharacterized protein n=1 Tax=Aminobacter aminovorans TaxID=83263 RepID=A0AAC9FE87_AMIAI|nr:hypothetical protein AA2016_4996 [Aminobacter aminovorans]MBB3705713.1 hypothetical protein [Aminobacter aminovorans]